ncbi:winged helix-turn-helix domain-containing protein [Novosphingobium soli]|uniref:Winged helix-turn-helix domain-containing protein n=1 Tax=Novosphingobium soli TaxID=574956 RepID=A0ABV6CU54_9SPHN
MKYEPDQKQFKYSAPERSLASALDIGRVLVVDADAEARDAIITYLSARNSLAVGLADSANVMRHLDTGGFSLVILDVQFDGFDVLRRIRERSGVPVIIITGQHQDDVDRIIGLELGADDYLLNPFNLRELLAKARATLRRQEIGQTLLNRHRNDGGFRFSGWELRRATRALARSDGTAVSLTKREYALLIAFLEAPRRILSREHLLQSTRAHDDVFDRSIDVHILRLRRKLEADPKNPTLIQTERGAGYILNSAVEQIF